MKDHTARALRDTTVSAIITEAEKRGAHAAPVFNRLGQVEEVHLFREGALQASISRPDAGRIWVWRPGRAPAYAGDIPEAAERGLDPERKQQHKEAKSQEMEPVRLMVAASSGGPKNNSTKNR